MDYQLLISGDARFDILNAFFWYEEQREGLGFDFELCLEAGFSFIQRDPLTIQIKYESIRIHFIDKFPYGIHYLVDDKIVRVFGVFHTSRNPEDWSERL